MDTIKSQRQQAAAELKALRSELSVGRSTLAKQLAQAERAVAKAENQLTTARAVYDQVKAKRSGFEAGFQGRIAQRESLIHALADPAIDEFLSDLLDEEARLHTSDASITPTKTSLGGVRVTTSVYGDATSRERRALAIVELRHRAEALKDRLNINVQSELKKLRKALPAEEFERVELVT